MPLKFFLKLPIQSRIWRAITECQTLVGQAETPSTEPDFLSRSLKNAQSVDYEVDL